jgi:stage V sporulation protein AE
MQILIAFLTGGAICAAVQILIDTTKLTPARILTGLVVLGVVLGAAGVYAPFLNFAQMGASVPLCGFGNALAQGVKKAVDEDGLVGVLKGPLSSGAAGITAAYICGLVASLFTKSKDK